MERQEIIVKTFKGLEPVVAQEVRDIGCLDVTVLSRAVKAQATLEEVYRLNLSLRTGLRILVPLLSGRAADDHALYEQLFYFPWADYLTPEDTFAIQATISGTVFTHSHFVSLRTKDAIADSMRKRFGRRPSVDTENPNFLFNIHIHEDRFTLSLDSTGYSLDRRGYRLQKTEAPLNEVLAAGIIKLSGWPGNEPFYDPMCGSGTFSIEAAMIAANMAPGIHRTFSFQNWPDYDAGLFHSIRESLLAQQKEDTSPILARDLDSRAISILQANAERAKVDEFISAKREDFFTSRPTKSPGWIFLNPPYDERLAQTDAVDFYQRIGSHLKQQYPDFTAWVLSGHLEAIKYFGLKPAQRFDLLNGKIPCKLQGYALFEGSRT